MQKEVVKDGFDHFVDIATEVAARTTKQKSERKKVSARFRDLVTHARKYHRGFTTLTRETKRPIRINAEEVDFASLRQSAPLVSNFFETHLRSYPGGQPTEFGFTIQKTEGNGFALKITLGTNYSTWSEVNLQIMPSHEDVLITPGLKEPSTDEIKAAQSRLGDTFALSDHSLSGQTRRFDAAEGLLAFAKDQTELVAHSLIQQRSAPKAS